MDTAIDDQKRMQSNQEGWNRRALAHIDSSYYDLDTFRAGKSSLRSLEQAVVGDVAGKDFLHLQCHIGLNAISWARKGANVTAVDFAERALEIGRDLAKGLNVDINFVYANIYDLPKVLEGSFDIVYTDYGVLNLLPDHRKWAQVIAHFLKPGGVFHIVEIHPILGALHEVDGELRLRSELYKSGPQENEVNLTYGDKYADAKEIDAYKQYSWPWSISTVFTALIEAGLRIEAFTEVPIDCRQRLSSMVRDENDEGFWRLPGDPVPLTWTCSARKPE
ncbi:type 12 methyltransferase [Lentzea sp. NBRC 105346]|uniref:class I SAM-dependent methyltransferase n=1 Tax=Lentzea sp. NBRC 105346 TaxID=3032205 RepID=UPI0024A588A5|nr:class I SAM-dependent methyltransferase [Lentzea sp. NBRC 105346]GLZ32001.1 type 12 methyltransferase [Lentzea sp. NBRC 105346]